MVSFFVCLLVSSFSLFCLVCLFLLLFLSRLLFAHFSFVWSFVDFFVCLFACLHYDVEYLCRNTRTIAHTLWIWTLTTTTRFSRVSLLQLLESTVYGERKGAAYGLAGLVKGLGILYLKQLNIMTTLQEAIQNKKNYRHREGWFVRETLKWFSLLLANQKAQKRTPYNNSLIL